MDLKMLWDNFSAIAEAENGIQQLQKLVFSLAIRGAFKLQHSNDKPASELLEKATQEKLSQVKNQRKRQTKEIKPIEIPEDWNLPSSWEWSSLENLGKINPRNEISDDLNTGFVPMPLVPTDYRDAVSFETEQWSKIKKGYTHFANDDVGLAKITPCFENRKSVVFSNLPNGYGSGTTELIIFRPLSSVLNSKFVLLFFKSPFFLENGANQLTGTAGQKRVPRDFVAKCPFPLPPLEEQKRIVKKVDELMELCDRAQASKKNRNELQQQLRRSAIHALETAETEEDFKKSWHFVRDNFSAIVEAENGIQRLRDLILNLAMCGKVVPPQSGDESAIKLKEKLKVEKEKLAKELSLKKSKFKPTDIDPEIISVDIPEHWQSIYLGEFALVKGGKRLPKGASFSSVPTPYIYVRVANFKNKSISDRNLKYIDFETREKIKNYIISKNDLYISIAGTIGKVGEVPATFDQMNLTENAARIIYRGIVKEFLIYVLNSKIVQAQFQAKINQQAQPKLALKRIETTLIPLPPLEEQKRIVSKVDELMKCCDRVEESLRKKEELASAISASIIHHLKL